MTLEELMSKYQSYIFSLALVGLVAPLSILFYVLIGVIKWLLPHYRQIVEVLLALMVTIMMCILLMLIGLCSPLIYVWNKARKIQKIQHKRRLKRGIRT